MKSSDVLWSSDEFSCSLSDSSEDDSRTGRAKSATLSQKRAWKQGSEGPKGRVKT